MNKKMFLVFMLVSISGGINFSKFWIDLVSANAGNFLFKENIDSMELLLVDNLKQLGITHSAEYNLQLFVSFVMVCFTAIGAISYLLVKHIITKKLFVAGLISSTFAYVLIASFIVFKSVSESLLPMNMAHTLAEQEPYFGILKISESIFIEGAQRLALLLILWVAVFFCIACIKKILSAIKNSIATLSNNDGLPVSERKANPWDDSNEDKNTAQYKAETIRIFLTPTFLIACVVIAATVDVGIAFMLLSIFAFIKWAYKAQAADQIHAGKMDSDPEYRQAHERKVRQREIMRYDRNIKEAEERKEYEKDRERATRLAGFAADKKVRLEQIQYDRDRRNGF
jgi:hypothetical protein